MRIDFEYHANRHPAEALNFIQVELGDSALAVPPVVTMVTETNAFRYFYTTNLDEVLAEAAADKPVAAYPDYLPLDAQVIYLHGRAATATSFDHDLVLGETAYTRAYGTMSSGLARTQVERLLPVPVLFIGFSMDDDDVMWTLRSVAESARRRATLAGGATSGVGEPVDWYALLPAPDRDELDRTALKAEKEKDLRAYGAHVIWYADGGGRGACILIKSRTNRRMRPSVRRPVRRCDIPRTVVL